MRSINEERSTPAVIRDAALRLFADEGTGVPVRRIATAAGVSPGLVVHHFGSKDGLRRAVDRHVLEVMDTILDELAGGSVGEALARHLPPGSPVPGYLRRMLLRDGPDGSALFRGLYETSRTKLDERGTPGRDPAVRAAFLLVNDLAVVLMRKRLAEVLDVDPLSAEGLERWTAEAMAIYEGGLE